MLVYCFLLIHLSLNCYTKPLGQMVQSTLTFQTENPLQADVDSDMYLQICSCLGVMCHLLMGNCLVLASYSISGVGLCPGYALLPVLGFFSPLPWSLPHRHLYICKVDR